MMNSQEGMDFCGRRLSRDSSLASAEPTSDHEFGIHFSHQLIKFSVRAATTLDDEFKAAWKSEKEVGR